MPTIETKQQLLDALEAEWLAFNAALDRLSPAQLTEFTDAAGWTGKDHIAHLAAWERSAAYFLRGKPRHKGLEVDEAVYLSGNDDRINAAIQQQTGFQTLAEARADLLGAHEELLSALASLTDADLQQPYVHFLPDEPGEGPGPRALNVVVGNSVEHYREHLPWIEALASHS